MKRTLALLLTCALGFGLLSGCTRANAKELTADPIKFTDADMMAHGADARTVHAALAGFGLELLQKTRAEKSTLVSPLSVALALSMAANGADGDTLTQFQEVLGGGVDLVELNGACVQLTQDYQGLTGSTNCSIANSLWVDPDGQIKDDFVGKCRGVFDAQVFQGELSDAAIVDDLNGWVSEHTNKMIPSIINEPFDENTALLLVNALYLKNKWLYEFDPLATHEREFHHSDGDHSRMDFLSKHDTTLSYLSDSRSHGVVLPYDDGRLAFFVLQPSPDADFPDYGDPFSLWLEELEGSGLSGLLDSREDAMFLSFAMPKFTAEWRGDLTGVLPGMGLEDAFVNGTANFSKMGDNEYGYYISQVIHAAKIEVNEKGTEAAAATVVAAPAAGAPPQDGITLVLDRPFLYGIVDLDTSVPLFLGTYE